MNKKTKNKVIIIILLIGLIMISGITAKSLMISQQQNDDTIEFIPYLFEYDQTELESQAVYVIDTDENSIVFSHNGTEKMYPASMTKLMTGLVALDTLHDFDEMLEISPDIYNRLYEADASMAGFQPYEHLSVRDLFYGMFVPSGAEATLTLVHSITDDEDEYVNMMNQKAQELGMHNTHYTNVIGLHDPEHYTTAEDAARLFQEALTKDLIKPIFSSSDYMTPNTPEHPDGLLMESTIYSRIDNITEYDHTPLLGGKTGYTPQAGQCLSSYGTVNGRNYLIVTGGAQGDNFSRPFHIKDHLMLYEALKIHDENRPINNDK